MSKSPFNSIPNPFLLFEENLVHINQFLFILLPFSPSLLLSPSSPLSLFCLLFVLLSLFSHRLSFLLPFLPFSLFPFSVLLSPLFSLSSTTSFPFPSYLNCSPRPLLLRFHLNLI